MGSDQSNAAHVGKAGLLFALKANDSLTLDDGTSVVVEKLSKGRVSLRVKTGNKVRVNHSSQSPEYIGDIAAQVQEEMAKGLT